MNTINIAQDKTLLKQFPDPEQIDPVLAVTFLLAQAGHLNPNAWQKDLHPDAFDPNLEPAKKRFLVNRVWRLTLGMLEEDTINARYCLVDQGSIFDWLSLFKQMVVPIAIKHQLPH